MTGIFVVHFEGPLAVLMKDCPKKWPEKSFKENDIFSMTKAVGSTLELTAKAFFCMIGHGGGGGGCENAYKQLKIKTY